MKCISVSRTRTEIESAMISRKTDGVMILTLNCIRYWPALTSADVLATRYSRSTHWSTVLETGSSGTRERIFLSNVCCVNPQLRIQLSAKAPLTGCFCCAPRKFSGYFHSTLRMVFLWQKGGLSSINLKQGTEKGGRAPCASSNPLSLLVSFAHLERGEEFTHFYRPAGRTSCGRPFAFRAWQKTTFFDTIQATRA